MKAITIKDIMEWCETMASDGDELWMEWGGGGDDGWINLYAGAQKCDGDEAEKLIDMLNQDIGYGWWNGNVSASGEAAYDPLTKTFRGKHTSTYMGYESFSLECDVEIRIPKALKFDRICLDCDGDSSEFEEIDCDIMMKFYEDSHHITTPEYENISSQLSKLHSVKFLEVIKPLCEDYKEFEICDTYDISRDDFTEDGDDFIYHIYSVTIFPAVEEQQLIDIDFVKLLTEKDEDDLS